MAFLTKSLAKDVFRGQQLANSKPDLSHDYTGAAPITAAHSNQEVNKPLCAEGAAHSCP